MCVIVAVVKAELTNIPVPPVIARWDTVTPLIVIVITGPPLVAGFKVASSSPVNVIAFPIVISSVKVPVLTYTVLPVRAKSIPSWILPPALTCISVPAVSDAKSSKVISALRVNLKPAPTLAIPITPMKLTVLPAGTVTFSSYTAPPPPYIVTVHASVASATWSMA